MWADHRRACQAIAKHDLGMVSQQGLRFVSDVAGLDPLSVFKAESNWFHANP